MATNAQVAYQAAGIKAEQDREADLEPRAEAFYNWLQTKNGGTPTAADISNAQAALLAAAHGYTAREGGDVVGDVTARADRLFTDIAAHAAGNGTA